MRFLFLFLIVIVFNQFGYCIENDSMEKNTLILYGQIEETDEIPYEQIRDEEAVAEILENENTDEISLNEEIQNKKEVKYTQEIFKKANEKEKIEKAKEEQLILGGSSGESFGYQRVYRETELYATYKNRRFELTTAVLQGENSGTPGYYNSFSIKPKLRLTKSLFINTNFVKDIGFDSGRGVLGIEVIPFKNHRNIMFAIETSAYTDRNTIYRQKLNFSTKINF